LGKQQKKNKKKISEKDTDGLQQRHG